MNNNKGYKQLIVAAALVSCGASASQSDASSTAQLRKFHGSSTAVSLASTITSPDLGIISISLTGSQTVNLKPGRYVYDVKILNAGREYKAVEGAALIRGGVTR